MGFFARFSCLRRDGTASDLAQTVRDLLKAQHVVEAADVATADRLMMIAPAGHGWLLLFDHVERSSEALSDDGRLLRELNCSPDRTAIDIIVADSDDLILSLMDGDQLLSQLEIGHHGLAGGALEPWQRLLSPGKSIDDIRTAFAKRKTFVEEHFPALEPLFGIDLAPFNELGEIERGRAPRSDIVLLRLKSILAPGETIGPPKLEVNDGPRQTFIMNRSGAQIPRGFVTPIHAFCFESRGGSARGLELRLTGSALDLDLIEIVSAKLQQHHPIDPKLNRDIQVTPEVPGGTMLRFPDLEVPDWVQPDSKTALRSSGSLHDFRVFVYCRGLKVGDGELGAEAHLVAPRSAHVHTSYPVTVLPEMWRPLKGRDQPHGIHGVLRLNQRTRVNGLAVLRGGADEALCLALETWRSFIDPDRTFFVSAATEPVHDAHFFGPTDGAKPFILDLSKKRRAKWDKLLADLPSIKGLSIASHFSGPPGSDYRQRNAARIVFHCTSAAPHPHLPEYAARLGHVSLSLPANQAEEIALVSLMQALASKGLIGQAYVAAWDYEDGLISGALSTRAPPISSCTRKLRKAGGHANCVPSPIVCGLGPNFRRCCQIAPRWSAWLLLARSAKRWR